jgi:hypothetical protein
MQLCFVSVHGPRETYFVDEPRISAASTKLHEVRRQFSTKTASTPQPINIRCNALSYITQKE